MHAPGTFCWIELATSDQNGAKLFYSSLFGWTFTDSPMGPNDFYTMFELEGRNAAAAFTLRKEQLAMGMRPNWGLYIAVDSADAAAARAAELGGRVISAPFDVFTFGRMAVIADPTGAVFCVWEAKDHIGVGVAGEPGALCWVDLSTPDQARATEFYGGLFGYTFPPGHDGYLHIKHGENYIGGILPNHLRNTKAPPHWEVYIQVADCAAGTAKAKELGAAIWIEKEIPNAGLLTVLADPQGAAFALFQPGPQQ